MNNPHIRTLEDAARTTAVWNSDVLEIQPRGREILRALVPAVLILSVATALLVALL